jgi:tRNA A37 threonylcarbamoyladenosine biosynthesis protein TsaE
MYDTVKFQIHHFDFYRLSDPGIVADELAEVSGDEKMVVVVEWADVVQHVLPENRLTVTLRLEPDGSRMLTFSAPAALGYLIEAIK